MKLSPHQRFGGFDFETSGEDPRYALQPWRVAQGKAWATSFIFVEKLKGEMSLDVRGGLFPTKESLRAILEHVLENDIVMIGWNTTFDISWLLAYGLEDLVWKIKWLDAMLLYRHHFIEPEYEVGRPNKMSYGLKPAVEKFIPSQAGYADEVDFHSTDPDELKKLNQYNIRDSTFTLMLGLQFIKKLTPKQLSAALIEAECLPMIARANLKGMMIDTIAARELQQHLADSADHSLTLLAPQGVTEKIVRSPIQLGKLMYDDWGLPVLKENTSKLTGKTTRSTDKEVLHELAFIDPRAKELQDYRTYLNNKGKFADNLLEAAEYNGDDCAHPSAFVFGTYSGRFTYASAQGKGVQAVQTGFALHQMPSRDKRYRGTIDAPAGYTILEFDAAGQEYRWMAIASNDPQMLQLCEPGEDPHSFMGSRISGGDYRKLIADVAANILEALDDRKLGKVGNLSLQYRTSARKLRVVSRVQYNIPMEMPQAQQIWKTYRTSYTSVPKYWVHAVNTTKQLGYAETFAGRRVQVVGDWSGNNGWSMESTAINYPIQGTGADQKYLALSVIRPYLTSIGAYFAWDLHDGIYLYVPNDKVKKAAVAIKYLLDNLPYEKAWGFTPPIALPWDCKVGNSWGSLKDFKFDQ